MQETAAIVVSNCLTIFTTISVIWVVMVAPPAGAWIETGRNVLGPGHCV